MARTLLAAALLAQAVPVLSRVSLRGGAVVPDADGTPDGTPASVPGRNFGDPACRCVGLRGMADALSSGSNSTVTKKVPADLGSACRAWDMDRDPDCSSSPPPTGCEQEWCFVDPRRCDLPEKPIRSEFFPGKEGAAQTPLHYSYATCRSVHVVAGSGAPGSVHGAPGSNSSYDLDGYKDDWRDEWRSGKTPAFRDMHPWVKEFEDRQSDGKASEVEEHGWWITTTTLTTTSTTSTSPTTTTTEEQTTLPDYLDAEACPHCVGLVAKRSRAP